jgi:hypothetical protein
MTCGASAGAAPHRVLWTDEPDRIAELGSGEDPRRCVRAYEGNKVAGRHGARVIAGRKG